MRIIEHFDNGVKYYPNNIAIVDVGGDQEGLSYADAQPVTHAVAGAIHARGYSMGGHVGILAPNCTTAFLALLGLFRAQSVWLPINPRNPVPVNADLLTRFDGELLLFHSSFAEQAQELLAQCPGIKEIVCIDRDCGVGTPMETWSEGAPTSFRGDLGAMDDTFAIFPTGGTTGKSKGVVLTHANIHTFFSNFYTHFSYHENTGAFFTEKGIWLNTAKTKFLSINQIDNTILK